LSLTIAKLVFGLCSGAIVYTYFIYPVILVLAYAFVQLRRDLAYLGLRQDRRANRMTGRFPSASILIPAYNEEKHLPDKMSNLRLLEYPQDELQIIFISDGSTDRTNDLIHQFEDPRVHVIELPHRSGKATALNRGASEATGEILVFCDATTILPPDGITKLARHFCDVRVGAVCGSLEFVASEESKRTEGKYWTYESMLRLMEGRLGATLTASGAYYAIRRECYRPLESGTIIDDFVIPMGVRKQGYRVVYDPEAVARELAADSVKGEFRRRVRIAVGSFRALPGLLKTPMSGITWFAFISHKVLRWIMPFLFIGLALSNIVLIRTSVYGISFTLQCLFYALALIGMRFSKRNFRFPYGLVCYFVCAMNLAFLVGFFRALRGNHQNVWQRAN
jgi:cellulose synthase/poly-beta-1,6-N-acetylglucosamine synthase-like glycosyltransferase